MSDRDYQVFVAVSPEAAVVVQDGVCRVIGPAFTALMGYTDADIGRELRFADIVATPATASTGTATPPDRDRRGGYFTATLKSSAGGSIVCEIKSTAIVFERQPAELVLVRDLSQLHETETALRRSEASYQTLFENMLEGIYQTRPDGTIMAANPALVKMLGYDSEDQLCTETRAGEIYAEPGQRAANLAALERDGHLRNAELVLKRRDGSLVTVLENARAVRDAGGRVTHYEGLLTDISERVRAQKDLRRTHEQLSATLDTLPDILFDVDHEGRIYDFRAPQPELLYLAPDKFLGKRVDQLLPKEAAEVVMAAIDAAVLARRSRGYTYSLQMGGETRWFEISLAAKGDPGQPARRFVGLVRDITDRKLNEERLEAATRALASERAELEAANTALRKVLDSIERRKLDYRQQVYRDLERLILRPVRKLRAKAPRSMADAVEEIELSIGSVLARDLDDYRRRVSTLTSRESQICDQIKDGASSKQISEALNLSLATVQKHREHIRHKLGLTGKGMSLATYLRVH